MTYQKCELPNGMIIYHLNRHETKFIYKEIFEEKIYMKHGISIDKRGVVLDVGANIGLFTLFVKRLFPDSKIYAFEPAPGLFKILQLNVSQYGRSVVIFQLGLSDKKEKAIFTYYPNYSILSGFRSDSHLDEQVLRSGVYNQLHQSGFGDKGRLEEAVNLLIKDKLSNKKEFECQLTTISNFIKEYGISRIDLLKVDAEKMEGNILKGINGKDWLKIKQIVMEVHDASRNSERMIAGLLKAKGFEVIVEEEQKFKGSGVSNIFAFRTKS
ncbi:MAG: hypothetical protein COS99_01395 [Candidatus Omnitrophica bacterium CG07_land_8_20_14_0_80_42_15]|uniref:Methyltransferase FkbM domain-containing protein n=1 Tax=Candidatus Aquitaenariimonas noxiae TaxID=1974741 RepID=A0A2J0KUY4_9BACT|nr:MAG: hypothetical protein COS99_01395 [Candidatus Omnitrophica bacterium CG07_land_8_20_14_0_80_42_15]